jgi:riboflavin synthase
MFTGIVEEVGTVVSKETSSLKIKANIVTSDVHKGDSIAVNGTCLTVTQYTADSITLDVMNETYSRTSLGDLKKGSAVNLERAMSANGRFGGHIVSGHIDGTGTITDYQNDGIAVWMSVSTSKDILKYIIMKGSIAIDGVSLTVAYLDDEKFKVSLIPHTAKNTTLLDKKIGDTVNLENDVIGKYVERLISQNSQKENEHKSNIDMAFLAKCGF